MKALKALKLTIRLHNNLLVERRKALGLSQAALCRKLHMCQPEYCHLENLRRYPWGTRRSMEGAPFKWAPMAVKLARFYKTTPEELFPLVFRFIVKSFVERKLDVVDSPTLLACISEFTASNSAGTAAEQGVEAQQLRASLANALASLTPVQRAVTGMYFGVYGEEALSSYKIAKILGVSGTRIIQIKDESLGLLRSTVETNLRGDPTNEKEGSAFSESR